MINITLLVINKIVIQLLGIEMSTTKEDIQNIKAVLKNTTILFVDKDKEDSSIIKESLSPFFKNVILVHDGLKAFTAFKKNPIDLVITDINIPNMNGVILSRKIKEIDADKPIIIYSEEIEKKYLSKILETGIDYFIEKPSNTMEILQKASTIRNQSFHKKEAKEQQEKLASVGDMMANITHQWKQPLHALTLSISEIELDIAMGNMNKNDILSHLGKIKNNVSYISQIIEDFRSFFDPNAKEETFNVSESFDMIFRVIKSNFNQQSIKIIEDFDRSINIKSYENALQQIIMNLLSNAKDALVAHKEKDRKILVEIKDDPQNVYISVTDNAGGIPENIINKIFKSRFSTKGKKGSGIGLSMSKELVIKKLNGDIEVHNTISDIGKGACFTIIISKTQKS
jgi:signal transduction histidine kinase